ncbi:MAG: hypothetical protein J6S08_04610 [Duodenibacillus sp.]|nr:hypothetical protein [Duodenibacillus sp.]
MSDKQTSLPKLFNPTAAVVLSLVFTPMFGAFLHGLNWRELGDDESAARSMGWVRGTFIAFVLYLVVDPFLQSMAFARYLMMAMLVGFWFSWALSLGFRQVRFVREFVKDNYEPQRLGKAIMLGAFGWVAFSALAFTIMLFLHVTGLDPIAMPPAS